MAINSNYKTAVVGIVEHDGQVLIGKRIKQPHVLNNMWHIPGGMVKLRERGTNPS